MIDKIIVGRGNRRKEVPLVRNRDERRGAANVLKGVLLGGKNTFRRHHARGAAALAAAR